MPHEWVDPEIKIDLGGGLVVYHAYDDDNMVTENWYTVDPSNCNVDQDNDEGTMFDVRDIHALIHPNDYINHLDDIRFAAAIGWLTEEGLKLPDGEA